MNMKTKTLVGSMGLAWMAMMPCVSKAAAIVGSPENAMAATVVLTADKDIDSLVVDGVALVPPVTIYPESFPTQYNVRPIVKAGSTKHFFRSNWVKGMVLSSDVTLWPNLDDSVRLIPPFSSGTTITNSFQLDAASFWVDAKLGSDSNAGSEAKPFATIQKAIDSLSGTTRTTVFVRPGDYGPGENANAQYGSSSLIIANKPQVRIVAVEGPEVTRIVGASDPQTIGDEVAPGCGPNAVRCLLVTSSYSSALQGFTLADGRADTSGASTDRRQGAAVDVVGGTIQVSDCIVSNCVATANVVNQIDVHRCRFVDCFAGDGSGSANYIVNKSAWFSEFVGCDIAYAGSSTFGLVREGLNHCTIIGAIKSGRSGGAIPTWNTVVDGGQVAYSGTTGGGSLFNNLKSYYLNEANFTTYRKDVDPLFVDRTKNGVVFADSPIVGLGDVPSAANFGADLWKCFNGDIEGNAIAFSADGKSLAGAYQRTVDRVVVNVAAPANGGFVIQGGDFGSYSLFGERTVSFIPAAGSRPCAGVRAGLQDFWFTNTLNNVIALDYTTLKGYGTPIAVEPIYTTDWYVDDDGDDENSGMLPSLARRTLVSAMSLCSSGDTLWALPGEYTEGLAASDPRQSVSNRVYVTAGVALRSTEGAAKTVIRGAAAKTDPDEYDRGSDGVRCVLLGWSKNVSGTIDGFTLADGHGYGKGSGYASELDAMGGGVLSLCGNTGREPAKGVWVRNCVITNCASHNGVATRVCLENCTLTDCHGGASLVHQGSAYGSYFNGNTATRVFNYSMNLVGSTIGADNRENEKNASVPFANATGNAVMRNTLVCLPMTLGGDGVTEIRNSVFAKGSNLADGHADTNESVRVAISDEGVAIDAAGVPIIGKCLAVDAGNNDWTSTETDLAGSQRIYNGTVDAGCFEADWRAVYAKRIGNPALVTVSEASADVVSDVAGRVSIAAGSLVSELTNASGEALKCVLKVSVDGGTLMVRLDGVPLVEPIVSGAREIAFEIAKEHAQLALTFEPSREGAGAATILSLRRDTGLIVVIR